jgi:hypothetical protein
MASTHNFLVTINSDLQDDEVRQQLSAALDSRFDDVDFEPQPPTPTEPS